MQTKKKTASKREVIQPHQGGTRYVRRNADGTFGKTVDVGRSLSADKRRTAKKKVSKGQGDRGDIATIASPRMSSSAAASAAKANSAPLQRSFLTSIGTRWPNDISNENS